MYEFLYHALGICGEHSHPNLINLSIIAFLIIGVFGYKKWTKIDT